MKRSWKALLLAMVLVVMPAAVFAAESTTTSSSSSSRDNSSNSSSHSSGGGGGGGSSSSGSSSSFSSVIVAGGPGSTTAVGAHGIIEVTNTTVTNAHGTTWNVGATYTRLDDGAVTALLGDESNYTTEEEKAHIAHVATGEAKLAGLPETTQTIIGELDWWDTSNVPDVDVTGYKTYGTTIAIRAEAGTTATLYCSELPENGAKILYYNNWTQKWMLIDCTVDSEAGTVTFTVPTSGTAQIIGE